MATTEGFRAATDDTEKTVSAPAYGVTQIDGQPATSVRFARSEKDGNLSYTVSFHMGNRQVARLKDLDREALTRALGDRNAKTVLEHGQAKGAIRGEDLRNEYGLSPREIARREAMRETQLADMEAEAQARDDADERNKIEHTPVRQYEESIESMLARAAALRQRDREQWLAERERLGLQAEDRRIRIENLSEKAQEQRNVNLLSERTGGETDYDNQQLTEREKNRQAQLMDLLHQQFRVSGAKFHFKDQPQKVAFTDKGSRIVSASNDERVAKAMATMVQAKGWKTITVSGHPDFRREVWMQASLQGIEVRGYKPQERDLRLLEEQRERQMKNSAEHDAARDRQKMDRMRANERHKEHRRKEALEAEKRRHETDRGTSGGLAPALAAKAAAVALGAHVGRVLAHGEAPYNHDPQEKTNYYVTLDTQKGAKTVWGIDLKRAMSEGQIRVGDNVRLEHKGNKPVTVQALVRDDAGKVIGKETIQSNRNEWDVQKTDRYKVVQAVASAVINAKTRNPAQQEALRQAIDARLQERARAGNIPALAVYDRAAPSQSQHAERARPAVERHAEQTR